MRIQFLLTLLVILFSCGRDDQGEHMSFRSKVGEHANYEVNKSRSSSLIKSGKALVEIRGEKDGKYQLYAAYEAKVLFKTYSGDIKLDVEKKFFEEEFKVELRKSGEYKHKKFKVKHLSYDGHCDTVLVHDVEGVDDVQIEVILCPEIPAAQAKKIDAKAKVGGQNLKVGLDYVE